MALNWQWNDKMGEVLYKDGSKQNLYEGNALMIALHEYEENGEKYYSLTWFADDKTHLKNMLGLSRNYSNENRFAKKFGIVGFRFNTRYATIPAIVSDLIRGYAKSKSPLTIELYYEEE